MKDANNFLNSFSNNEIAVILVLVGFAGSIIGFFFKRLFKSKDSERENISNACQEFLASFDHITYKLTATGDFADVVLFKEMPLHKIAYDKFRRVLVNTRSAKTVNRLDEIWNEYYCSNPTEKYDTTSMGKDVPRELVLKRIEAIKDFVNTI